MRGWPGLDLRRRDAFRAGRPAPGVTDWTAYYAAVPVTARVTRRYTTWMLVRALRAALGKTVIRQIVELGGANSCFLTRLCATLRPQRYLIIDGNAYGLSLLDHWQPPASATTTLAVREADIRTPQPDVTADAVFSVGLIEHFDETETWRAVRAHFDLVRSGGVVLMSYPTPTWLYRAARRALESAGLWKFHDERPLVFAEIERATRGVADLLERRTLWPLILTQEMVVFRKR